ncbi:MAG TPA: AAA family ATPase [Candidatus Nanopelagicales bacterium]|nr:AAA family ATPase [Candidatus Nanopelagicales bacterium]
MLFVDLEDFTGLAESMDPEDVRNLQARYFEAARSVVAHYGGTLEKFIGDAVMAVWGAPIAHEDDGERAVRAALELVAAVARLRGAVPGRRLSARAAVGTGEAAVTPGVEGQGIVAGDLVNTAARLQAAAPSSTVLVDDTTRRVVGDAVAFEPVGPTRVKGRNRPIAAWRAVRVAAERPKGRAAGHSGPFVGRRTELAELVDLHERTVAARRSRIVSVLGIAGIGKSRLVWEFERHLDAQPQGLALHVGRAPSYGEGITFAPLAEMVRRRARISEGTETEVAKRQLARTLDELVPDQVQRRWIEPRLATLLDPGSHVAFERDELFAAWRQFFECVSEWAPVLLIFEDLQWADPALLDFIDHLATWSRAHPILIVTLARPELLDRRPTWGAGHHSFTAIHLEPLLDEQMAELLLGLGPDLPPGAVRRIVERAGGVPLYGVEVLRMLVDRGQARTREQGFELLDTLDEMQIPDTLRSLVSARIDALPPAERSLLLSASVLGSRFHPDALAAIGRLATTEARDRIAALVHRELVTVDDEPRSPGRGQLSFVQEVVRDVAYSTVSLRDRRTLHLAAADHLEALGDDELVEAIAEHLLAAHEAAPDRAGAPAVARRAVGALRLAAARALALRVPAQALTHLLRALELVDDEASRAVLWHEAATAARAAPRFDLAESFLRQLIDWQEAKGRRDEVARTRARLASLLLATERPGSALDDLQAALEGVSDLASDASSVELGGQLARAHVLVGDDQLALDWANRTLEASGHLGLPAVAVDALITRGTAQMRLGNDAAGLADLHAAIADAQRLGLIGAELRARNNLAWLVAPDDPQATMETARGGLELATRMGVGDMALQLAEVVCTVAIDTGDWDPALVVLEEVRDRPQAPAHRIQFVAIAATLRALRGDARAEALLDGLEPLDPETDPQILAGIDQARAWIALVDGRREDAERLAESAGARSLGAERHAALVLATRAALWLGDQLRVEAWIDRMGQMNMHGRAVLAAELTLRAGAAALADRESAGPMYMEAIASWRSLRLPLHLALCLAERQLLLPTIAGAVPDVGGAEAEAILTDLGAAGMLRAISLLAADQPRRPGHPTR